MKRIRIIALALSLLLVFPLLVSCDKLSLDAVKEDPLKAVEEGVRLLLKKTPFAALSEESAARSYRLELDALDFEAEAEAAVDTEAEKSFFDLLMTSGEEKVDLAFFSKGSEIALKSSFLNELFGTDTLGVDLEVSEEEWKNSALYGALEAFGLIELLGESQSQNEDAAEALETFLSDVENLWVVENVAEEAVGFEDGKEVGAICVTMKLDEKKLEDAVETLLESLLLSVEEGADTDPDAVKEAVLEALAELHYTEKTYLSKKSGVLLKTAFDFTLKSETEEEELDLSVKCEASFGSDPEALFLPKLDLEMTVNGETLTLNVTSKVEELKLAVRGDLKMDAEGEEADKKGAFTLAIDADGNYELVLLDEEDRPAEDVKLTGKLCATENGVEWSLNASAEGEETSLKLVVTTDANVQALPEYKDVLSLGEEEVSGVLALLMGGMTDAEGLSDQELYEEYFKSFVTEYNGVTAAELEEELSQYASYAEYGFTSEFDYLCYLYASNAYSYLASEGVSTDAMDEALAAEETYFGCAVAMDGLLYENKT